MATTPAKAAARERAARILSALEAAYPGARIALRSETPFQLLVAVILSAQCTDERVNQVTPELFRRFPDAAAMAEAPLEEIEALVRPTGFFRNKARNIQAAARRIVERHGGEVPCRMEDLLALPGVARKTANIVLYNACGRAEGVAVDTHVKRLAGRLGLSAETRPDRIERDLMALFPKEKWGPLSYLLIEHGRAVCRARRPLCPRCPLRPLCPWPEKTA
ncbi:endonuclease III [Dissulfurirhabdus thermomarina]|uniref:Endonuclease III n=1 Tax=Dissulfurirhabdus thermomarina TaxID=1765737 RepID=A0A6N9TNT7_DISTH|nr:endonuclease III [Dissulfurirhabdus thermomarina]NDY42925.1 endonuclease III [Dissulfurirhabdus thermomarina]NMX23420.1 endonuclease III [Dissulfurirhabdus thermomarina]